MARRWWASPITAPTPSEELAHLPRLGGPKNPHIEEIIALQPELVLANWEENTRPAVEALEDAGIFVWVTFPKSVRQALDVLWTLVGLYSSREAAIRLEVLEMTLEWAKSAAADKQPVRYFCPIWRDTTGAGQAWWMTFNQETYTHDLLASLGGENIFAGRQRRYPLEADLGWPKRRTPASRDTRYPRVTLEEIRAANPQVILLPDEPFEFGEQHIQEMQQAVARLRCSQKRAPAPGGWQPAHLARHAPGAGVCASCPGY